MLNTLPSYDSSELVVGKSRLQIVLAEDTIPTGYLTLPPLEEIQELKHPLRQEVKVKLHLKPEGGAKEVFLDSERKLLQKHGRFKESPTYLNHLATLAALAGEQLRAEEYWKQGHRLRDDLFFGRKIGDSLIKRGDLDGAVGMFKAMGSDIYANLRLAYVAVNAGHYEIAMDHVQRALQEDVLDYRSNWLGGAICLVTDRPEEAIRYFRVANESKPNAPALHMNMGIAHYLLGAERNALKEARMAVALNPLSENAVAFYTDLRDLYDRQTMHTVDVLENYLEYCPDSLLIRNRLAKLYCDTNQFAKAIKALKIAASKHLSTAIWNNLGATYWRSGDLRKASAFFSYAVNLGSEQREIKAKKFFADEGAQGALVNLLNLLAGQHKYQRVLKIAEEFIGRAPDNRFLYDKILSRVFLNYLRALYYSDDKEKTARKIETYLKSEGQLDNILRLKLYIQLSYHYAVEDVQLETALYHTRQAYDLLNSVERRERARLEPVVVNNWAYALIEMNRTEEAMPVINRLGGMLARSDPIHAATLGLWHLKKSQIERGKELYLKAIDSCKDRYTQTLLRQKLNLELGRAYLHRTESREARLYLSRAAKSAADTRHFREEAAKLLKQIK